MPKMLRRLFPVALFLLVATPVDAQQTAADRQVIGPPENPLPYSIRPGDRITTRLFAASGEEVNQVSDERTVDANGAIYMPFVGSVDVEGETEESLRTLLVQLYEPFYQSPVLNVSVELRVNVTGAVGTPGQYYLDPTATVLDAMAEAGGMGSELAISGISLPADPSSVRLVRDAVLYILNLRPEDVSNDVLNMRVRSGDWYHVPFRGRSRVRDEITFWGGVLSFASTVIGLLYLIGGG